MANQIEPKSATYKHAQKSVQRPDVGHDGPPKSGAAQWLPQY
jgi:hypothetical protein